MTNETTISKRFAERVDDFAVRSLEEFCSYSFLKTNLRLGIVFTLAAIAVMKLL